MKYLQITLLLFLCQFTLAQKTKIAANTAKSSLKYFMSHPLHDWDAKAKEFKTLAVWNSETKKIELAAVVVAVKDFDSDNSNRDSHALEELEALKYPTVSFSSKEVNYTGDNLSISGILDFHGVKKPISSKATQELSNGELKIVGSFDINMVDFGIDPPGLMGVKTKETIQLEYSFVFTGVK